MHLYTCERLIWNACRSCTIFANYQIDLGYYSAHASGAKCVWSHQNWPEQQIFMEDTFCPWTSILSSFHDWQTSAAAHMDDIKQVSGSGEVLSYPPYEPRLRWPKNKLIIQTNTMNGKRVTKTTCNGIRGSPWSTPNKQNLPCICDNTQRALKH